MKAHKTEYRIARDRIMSEYIGIGYDWLEVYNGNDEVQNVWQKSPETIINIKDWPSHSLSHTEVKYCDTYPTKLKEIN